MRRNLARLALLSTVLALVACAPALGQGAFSPLPQAAPDTTPTAATTTTTKTASDQGGLKRWQEILLFMGGVALIGGIAYAILSDARRLAPVSENEASGHGITAAGARKAQSKEQARKRAKAARAARKRNRAKG